LPEHFWEKPTNLGKQGMGDAGDTDTKNKLFQPKCRKKKWGNKFGKRMKMIYIPAAFSTSKPLPFGKA
jgi:hypothetical protein